eukprot:COSAG04_NODE_19506_length_414_cov_1.504762_1_plen_113_part_01
MASKASAEAAGGAKAAVRAQLAGMASGVTHDTVVYYHDGGDAKRQELEDVWLEVDVDRSGSLDRDEVKKVLGRMGMPDDEASVDAAMAELDKDGDGSIVYEEFVSWYLANDEQ